MIYFRYILMLSFIFSLSSGDGIINTQSVLSTEKQTAKEKLKDKKEDVLQSIGEYKTKLEEGNEELKKSIKLLKAIVEIKKNTLLYMTEAAEHQKNVRRLEK